MASNHNFQGSSSGNIPMMQVQPLYHHEVVTQYSLPPPVAWAHCTVCNNKVSLDKLTYYAPSIGICRCCQERGRSVDNMDFTAIRPAHSYLVESRELKGQCEYYASGCEREGSLLEMQSHGIVCGFRDIRCYESKYQCNPSRWDDCQGVKVPLPMYQRHLSEVHSFPTHYGPSVSIIRCVDPPLDYFGGWKRWPPTSILHEGFGFLWHCYAYAPSPLNGGIIYTWLSILADQGWANKYLYKLEVEMPTNSNIRWSWDLPVVQYHNFSVPSDYSATIPVGTIKKMICKEQVGYGTYGFEMKITVSNMMLDLAVENPQPLALINPNRMFPIQQPQPLPPPPVMAVAGCSRNNGGDYRRN